MKDTVVMLFSLSLSLSDSGCGEMVRLCVFVSAAAVMFPLLTWAGYELLPFNAPPLDSAPLRLIYTLRCAFFPSLPIVLGERIFTFSYKIVLDMKCSVGL